MVATNNGWLQGTLLPVFPPPLNTIAPLPPPHLPPSWNKNPHRPPARDSALTPHGVNAVVRGGASVPLWRSQLFYTFPSPPIYHPSCQNKQANKQTNKQTKHNRTLVFVSHVFPDVSKSLPPFHAIAVLKKRTTPPLSVVLPKPLSSAGSETAFIFPTPQVPNRHPVPSPSFSPPLSPLFSFENTTKKKPSQHNTRLNVRTRRFHCRCARLLWRIRIHTRLFAQPRSRRHVLRKPGSGGSRGEHRHLRSPSSHLP